MCLLCTCVREFYRIFFPRSGRRRKNDDIYRVATTIQRLSMSGCRFEGEVTSDDGVPG